jgi:flavin-dependent dehydrogenase
VFPEPVDRPEDYPYFLCVRRITLDAIMNQRVLEFGEIDFRAEAKVDGLIRNGDNVIGVSWQADGAKREARGRAVIGADGIHSSVAKWVDAQVEQTEPVNRTMYYAYYRNLAPNDGPAAEFHFRGNNLVYCFPTDGDLTLLAASVPIVYFDEFRKDPEGRLHAELMSMVALRERLALAEREGPVRGTGSIGGYLRVPYGDGWALVGDAAMAMDPWSGQGIDQASTHAMYLSESLNDYLGSPKDWHAAMQNYHQRRNEFSLKAFNRTCTYSRDLQPMTRAALESRGLSH